MWDLELIETAERIVREVAALRPEDKVLVVTDAAKLNIGKALGSASRMLGTETVLAVMPMTGEHGNEPPATIAAAMAAMRFGPSFYRSLGSGVSRGWLAIASTSRSSSWRMSAS